MPFTYTGDMTGLDVDDAVEIEEPIGSDPPNAALFALPFEALADRIKLLQSKAGMLAKARTWTALQTFSAGLTSVGATFTAGIFGTTGTFSGVVVAATAAITGLIGAADIALSGGIVAVTGAFSGAVSGASGAFVGAVSGASGAFVGAVTGASAAFTGAVTGASAAFTKAGGSTVLSATSSGSGTALILTSATGVPLHIAGVASAPAGTDGDIYFDTLLPGLKIYHSGGWQNV